MSRAGSGKRRDRGEVLQRECDFYRGCCDDLGSRVLRLQEEQSLAHRDARRWRTTARIIAESYRTIHLGASPETIASRILASVLDNVMCDRAALLRARGAGEFSVEEAVGYRGGSRPENCRVASPPDFACVSSRARPSPATDDLRAVAGLPFLLWCFDRPSGYALLLANRSEGNVARPFEDADRPILQGVLDMLLDLEEKERLRREREVLVDELQHRVRNNLQVVYGMLSNEIERRGEDRPRGIEAIARRVLTMAEVYDHLLGRGMSRVVDFGAYLADLCASLGEFQSGRFPGVALSCDAEPVHVELETVMSIGLAVAELIANGYEHAFPGGEGSITVRLRATAGGSRAVVTVSDDGTGFAPEEAGKRHGIGLVRRLATQAGGSIERRAGRGTSWAVELPAAARLALP